MTTPSGSVAPLTPPTDKPDALYEYVKGEWRETPRMGAFAGLLASILVSELNAFARPRRLGLAFSEVLFRLAQGLARRPDVAFVASDRWPYSEPFEDDPPVFDVVPNLVVEVNSPSNNWDEILLKIAEYFVAGTQLVWVFAPRVRQVYVYTSPEDVRILSARRDLEGGAVLPGFRLPLADFFASSILPTEGE